MANTGNVLDLGYNMSLGGGNNGNVHAITNNKDSSRSQSFTYDALNRLTSAQTVGTDCSKTTLNTNQTEYWGNSYGYDAWGNLLSKSVTKCSAENLQVSVFANNQLSGYGYDAAGNMTSDPTDGVTATYDPENRISTASKSGASTTYTYDADGNRVKKLTGSAGTLYWYMSPGIVAESDLSGNLKSEYVFFDGERVARRDSPGSGTSPVFYYFSDHLKTTDIVTDAQGNIKNESDFYPWGGELQFSANDTNHYKFTGKERDTESGLDYFGARYYSNGLGRFITPDWAAKATAVPYAEFADPQSLNLYSYVRNIPTSKADVDGHCLWDLCIVEGIEVGITIGEIFAAGSTGAMLGAGAGAAQMGAHPGNCYGPCFSDGPLPGSPNWNRMMADVEKQRQALNQSDAQANGRQGSNSGSAQSSGSTQNSSSTQGGNLSKPPRGKGSVPKDQRDPKRTATDKDKAKMRAEQKGNCAHCDQPLGDEKGIGHHDPLRHADGGSEMKLVHEKCHNDLHSCN